MRLYSKLFSDMLIRKILILVLSVLLPSVLIGHEVKETNTSLLENERGTGVIQWVERHFAKGTIPPFSFVYGGRKSDRFILNWQYSSEKVKSDEPNTEVSVYTYTDNRSGLVVACTVTVFTDFPAVEWVLKFTNTSGRNTPVIENAAVIEHSFFAEGNGAFILHHSKGSNGYRDDFKPMDDYLQNGKNIYFSPVGGRSSGTSALPFFNIEMPGQQGIVVGVGWTGKWYADVSQRDEKYVTLKSGMEKLKLQLYPERRNPYSQDMSPFLERRKPDGRT
jgi:alpha-galactosidase